MEGKEIVIKRQLFCFVLIASQNHFSFSNPLPNNKAKEKGDSKIVVLLQDP